MCTVKDYVNKSVTPNTSNAGDASIEERYFFGMKCDNCIN
jgi:hypothetical protein